MPRGEPGPDVTALSEWIVGLGRGLQRAWTTLTATVNGLCKADTLANRAATIYQNELFFIASDTKQLFASVAGAWENVGPRRGSASVGAGLSTATVTLSPAEADANYRVMLTANWGTTVSYASKLAGSFVINTGTVAPGGGGTVDYLLVRD